MHSDGDSNLQPFGVADNAPTESPAQDTNYLFNGNCLLTRGPQHTWIAANPALVNRSPCVALVDRMTASHAYLYPSPQTCKHGAFYSKRNFAELIKLRVFPWLA